MLEPCLHVLKELDMLHAFRSLIYLSIRHNCRRSVGCTADCDLELMVKNTCVGVCRISNWHRIASETCQCVDILYNRFVAGTNP